MTEGLAGRLEAVYEYFNQHRNTLMGAKTHLVTIDMALRSLSAESARGSTIAVPVEPTPEMLCAATGSVRQFSNERALTVYRAMLAAAPAEAAIQPIPVAVSAWFEAQKAFIGATDTYNKRVEVARSFRLRDSISCDPEYQEMERTRRVAHGLLKPMYDALAAAPAEATDPLGVQPCCGNYTTCHKPCTVRGAYLERAGVYRNQTFAGNPAEGATTINGPGGSAEPPCMPGAARHQSSPGSTIIAPAERKDVPWRDADGFLYTPETTPEAERKAEPVWEAAHELARAVIDGNATVGEAEALIDLLDAAPVSPSPEGEPKS